VDIKPADAATYRDRINSALGFWFGETFSPGRTIVECNAPKVVAAILYLATFGEVKPNVEDVARVLRKGPQAKNANYAVDEVELVKLGVSVAQLKALFEGPSRVERGFPRGVPLALPDLDALPEPAPPPKSSADGPTDATAAARRDARSALAKKKTVPEKPSSKVNERVVLPPSVGATPAAVGTGPGSELNPDPDQTEGAGESGGGAAEKKTRSRTPRHAAPRQPSNDGSPLFSPVGGVTAAFAAAALMPSANDRSSAVRAFLETHVAPALARTRPTPGGGSAGDAQLRAGRVCGARGEFSEGAAQSLIKGGARRRRGGYKNHGRGFDERGAFRRGGATAGRGRGAAGEEGEGGEALMRLRHSVTRSG
jgi:hypothetical protein